MKCFKVFILLIFVIISKTSICQENKYSYMFRFEITPKDTADNITVLNCYQVYTNYLIGITLFKNSKNSDTLEFIVDNKGLSDMVMFAFELDNGLYDILMINFKAPLLSVYESKYFKCSLLSYSTISHNNPNDRLLLKQRMVGRNRIPASSVIEIF